MSVTRYKLTPPVVEARNRYVRDWRRVHDLRRVAVGVFGVCFVCLLFSVAYADRITGGLAILLYVGGTVMARTSWPDLDEYLADVELEPENVEDEASSTPSCRTAAGRGSTLTASPRTTTRPPRRASDEQRKV